MPSTVEPTFHSLAEEFLRQHRAGQNPCVEDFVVDFPHLEDEIRAEFPALLLAEQLKEAVSAPAVQSIKIPDQVSKYRVGKELGKGGMGFVYAATHSDLGSRVALKVLPFSNLKSESALKRFNIEARSCAKMDHPNIVPVFDHGIESDFAYLAMRRIEGVSLDKLVVGLSQDETEGAVKLDWTFISQIGGSVANALHYAHAQGIVHRDIKPANLILDKNSKVWVTDFGLAKLLQSNLQISATGDIVGTPRYMAPEQLRGACDERSDIYSLGLTLYELASGRPVWETLSGRKLLARRQCLELPDIREVNAAVPEGLAAIIMNACALQPDDRYQSAQEMCYQLNQFAHGSPVVDRRKERQAKAQWQRRRSQIGFVLSVITLAAASAVGVGYYDRPASPYRDSKSALAILQDDQVRDEFVKALPDLLNDIVQDSDPEVRTMVGDIAEDVVDGTLEFENPDDQKAIRDRVQQVMQPYTNGEIGGEALLQGVARLVDESEGLVMRLQDVVQFVVASDASKQDKVQMLTIVRDALRNLFLGAYEDDARAKVRYQLDLIDATQLDLNGGKLPGRVLVRLLEPIDALNEAVRLANAESMPALPKADGTITSSQPATRSRSVSVPHSFGKDDAKRMLNSLSDQQRSQAQRALEAFRGK